MNIEIVESNHICIRQALRDEFDSIYAIDNTPGDEEERRKLILKSLDEDNTYIALRNNQIIGYIILEHSFFNRGFISMLFVELYHRRSGIGSALIQYIEGFCKSDRIFTSTNSSNKPMQDLLKKLEYNQSGIVNDLDPGDPELFYSKKLLLQ